MPILKDKEYLLGNVTPSFYRYRHIQTAKGITSTPIDDYYRCLVYSLGEVGGIQYSSLF